MPRMNAAEAMPMPEPEDKDVHELADADLEEVEDLTGHAKEDDEPMSGDTEEALEELRMMPAARDLEKSEAEYRAQVEAKLAGKPGWSEEAAELIAARKDLESVPDMTKDAKFEDPREEAAHLWKSKQDREYQGKAAKFMLDQRRAGEVVDELSAEAEAEAAAKKPSFLDRLKKLFR